MSATDHSALLERFRAALRKATDERAKRLPGAWMRYEREAMLAEVNEVRGELGLPPATVEQVMRCDQMATGHVDWAMKFPLYCMELATTGKEPAP